MGCAKFSSLSSRYVEIFQHHHSRNCECASWEASKNELEELSAVICVIRLAGRFLGIGLHLRWSRNTRCAHVPLPMLQICDAFT